MKSILLIIALTFTIPSFAQDVITSGEDVIRQMHQRYNGKWYPNITFKQRTRFYKNDSLTSEQLWLEAKSPDGLIIKFESFDSGNGVIFRNDSQYVFQEHRLVNATPRIHELLVLGFDVFFDDPEITIQRVGDLGINLDKFYETNFRDRNVIVVGIDNPDGRDMHFIIDKERMLFMKVVKFLEQGQRFEAEFLNYEKLGKTWIAPKVLVKMDGSVVMEEDYYDIEIPKNLPLDLVDINNFSNTTW